MMDFSSYMRNYNLKIYSLQYQDIQWYGEANFIVPLMELHFSVFYFLKAVWG